jgi:hypothetical protein
MCGPARPSGTDYLGKWEDTIESPGGGEGRCHLDIAAVGRSYLVKSERQQARNCVAYEGVWTLTSEGNLRGGQTGNLLMSYDKVNHQTVVSGLDQLRYLRRPTQEELLSAAFEGTWIISSRHMIFQLRDLGGGHFELLDGAIADTKGTIVWGKRWQSQLSNGALIVNFPEGSATITRVSDAELTYEESDAFSTSKSKAERAR